MCKHRLKCSLMPLANLEGYNTLILLRQDRLKCGLQCDFRYMLQYTFCPLTDALKTLTEIKQVDDAL